MFGKFNYNNFQNAMSDNQFSNLYLFSGISKNLFVLFTWKLKAHQTQYVRSKPFPSQTCFSSSYVSCARKMSIASVPIRNPGVTPTSTFTILSISSKSITKGSLICLFHNLRGGSVSLHFHRHSFILGHHHLSNGKW